MIDQILLKTWNIIVKIEFVMSERKQILIVTQAQTKKKDTTVIVTTVQWI